MDDVTPERWLPVVGWEGLYEVSSAGLVRSLPRRGGNNRMYGGKLLRASWQKASKGKRYLAVSLSRDGNAVRLRIHKLVAEAFLGPCPPGREVRHGPNGVADNSVLNLCYGTHAENATDTIRDGNTVAGSKNHHAKLTEADVVEIRRRHASGEAGYRALGREYGVDFTAIRFVIKRKKWKHVA
jgi:NUMOD4 motif/HNH endonuclease